MLLRTSGFVTIFVSLFRFRRKVPATVSFWSADGVVCDTGRITTEVQRVLSGRWRQQPVSRSSAFLQNNHVVNSISYKDALVRSLNTKIIPRLGKARHEIHVFVFNAVLMFLSKLIEQLSCTKTGTSLLASVSTVPIIIGCCFQLMQHLQRANNNFPKETVDLLSRIDSFWSFSDKGHW